MKNLTLVDLIVRTSAGIVDEEASVEKFLSEARKDDAAGADARALTGEAINMVFDTYKGRVLTKPVLTSHALQHLGVTPENHGALTEAVDSWLKANTGEGKTLMVKKGKGGGFSRTADMPAPEATETAS